MAIDNHTFIQALASANSELFEDRLADGSVDLEAFAQSIDTYPTKKNDFITVLTNQIGKQLFFNKVYENPYKIFKKGALPYGKSIESIFVDIIKGKARSNNVNSTDGANANAYFKTVKPNVKVEYMTENSQIQYQATITDEELKGAFRNANGLSEMTSRILQAPLTSAEYDEFLIVKKALANLKTANATVAKTEFTKLTNKEKAQQITTLVKEYVKKLKFMSNKYNAQGVMTFTRPQDLVLFVPAEISAFLDVHQLAEAFNVGLVELPTRVLDIDYFVSAESDAADEDALAYLIDKDAIQIYDTLTESESWRNGQAKYTNIWFDYWKLIGSCHFANAIKFKLV